MVRRRKAKPKPVEVDPLDAMSEEQLQSALRALADLERFLTTASTEEIERWRKGNS